MRARRSWLSSHLLIISLAVVSAVVAVPAGATGHPLIADAPGAPQRAAPADGPREQFYDAAGQLVGVTDPAGGAAAYSYDDAGNLRATTRLAAGELAVFALVPARGPVGTSVEISGTGFAADPAGNRVEFDGIRAQVTAATPNRITAVVPDGATDGAVTVSANDKTANSPRPFRVEAATPAPTITAVSTDRGNRNDLVTITGTGFDPTEARNVVMFHRTVARVQTASATSLTVRVPAAASSGKISVRTAGGTTYSQGDFLVAPRGFVMRNLVDGGRLAVGGPTVTLTVPAGKSALVLLDGVAGEQVNLRFAGNTIPVRSALWLYTPYGGNFARGTLGDPLDLWAGNDLSQDLPKFTTTGTYALVLDPNDDETGSVRVTASTNLTGARLTADGSGVPFQVTVAQQAVEFPFTATANQWLSLGMTDISEPSNTLVVKATAPDGRFQTWSAPLTQYTPTMVFKPWQTGTWKLSITFGPNQLGFGRVWLSTVVNGATLAVNGAAVEAKITRPGQSVRLPFAGTAGQVLQLGFSENTLQAHNRPQFPSTIMAEPDDVQVELRAGFAETRDIPPLRKTGQHSIFVTGWLAVGSIKAWLSTPAEAGVIAVNSKKKVTVDRPGRDVWLDYDGVKDRPLYLTTTDKSLPGEVTLRLFRPGGTFAFFSGRTIDVPALPDTGRYRIRVDPESPGMGDVSVVAVEPLDVGELTPDAAATPATVTLPGRRIVARFAGQAGQRLTFGATGGIEWLNTKIFKPDNTQLGFFGVVDLRRGLDLPPLPVAGTYRIELTPYQEATGELAVMLYGEADGGTAEIGGQPRTIVISKPGQNGKLAFAGAVNDALEFEVGGLAWDESSAYTLYGPDGAVVQARTFIFRRITALPVLRAAGTYTMVIDIPRGTTGVMQVGIRRKPTAAGPAEALPKPRGVPRQKTAPQCATAAMSVTAPRAPAPAQPGQPPIPDEPEATPQPAPGCENTGWTPDAKNLDGQDWTTRKPPPSAEERARQFPAGVTGVAGRVLDTTDRPLANVTVGAGDRKVTTDGAGRFVLTGVPAGHLALRVDGRTASRPGRRYGVFDIGVDVADGKVLVLSHNVFLPVLDEANTVPVDSPTTREVVLTTKAIPGLEVHIPAGTVVRDADGKVATELNLTAVPIDRPPFPLPPTKVPVYFTLQPGGGVLFPQGARIIYPNYTKEPPGTRTHFWNYDPDGRGWHIYGLGTVSKDGRQIIPDPQVRFYRLTGAMTAVPGMNPPPIAPRANGARVGDPVDPATGLLVDETVDLTVDDIVPIQIKRTYQQGDPDTRAFGIGMNFDYGMFPWSPGTIGNFDFQQFDLIQPDGSKIHYQRTSPGTDYAGAVFKADPTPTRYDGSTVRWNGDGWDVELRDGTVIVLADEAPMQEIRDKYGNTTTITRATSAPGTDGKVRQNGAITQITSPSGRWVRFTYDSGNPPRIASIEDNLGRKVGYTYHPSGHLATVTNPDNGVTSYTWDSKGRLETITDPRNTRFLRNEYDDKSRVKLQEAADGGLTRFDYVDVNGVVTETKVTDPREHVRRFTFNSKGSVLTDTRAFGTDKAQATVTEYDASGVRPATTTDALNRKTRYVYDNLGQIKELTVLADTDEARTEKFERNGPHGELTKHTDEFTKDTSYERDGRGALKSITDPVQRKTLFDVNGSGLVTAVTDPAQKKTVVDYVGVDAVRSVDPLGRATRTAFDAIGRPVRSVDPRGAATDTVYTDLDQVRSVTDPLGRTTVLGYDRNGNLETVTDAREGVTTYRYDAMDRVEKVIDPLGAVESRAYDRNGNLKRVTSRRDVVTEHDYDELDRRSVCRFGAESTATYVYDAGNRLRRTEDSQAGVSTVDYDGIDRVTRETTVHGEVSYSYSRAVRDRTMTVPGAPTVRHLYDAGGGLSEIHRDGAVVTAVGRDAVGRPNRVGAPGNGVHQTYGYDDAGQTKTITYRAGTTVLGDLAYGYDPAGNPVLTSGAWSRGRLPEPFGPATYDKANRLKTVGETSVEHDADGNLTSDGRTTYTWNARGQLSGLFREGATATFEYGTDGRRLARTVDGTRTTYLYDGVNPLQEKVNGAVAATMTSAGVDGWHLRESGGATKRYLTDAQGSTLGLVDGAGAGAAYSYELFGGTDVTGDDGGNPYRYTGREDDGTGLYHYRARYYSPVLRRFLSEDPIGFAGGINRYTYVDNRPTTLTDATGTKPDPYRRPSGFRSGVRDSVWDDAVESSTGRVRDPVTGQFMSRDKPWDMGHLPGMEHRKHAESSRERGIDRRQFLDEYNDPTHYRPELPGSNRSHRGEDPSDRYIGY